jgi:hypothetical protein
MNREVWLAALAGELSRHGVGPDLAGHVVAEAIVVVTHLLNQLDRVDIVLDLTPARERTA